MSIDHGLESALEALTILRRLEPTVLAGHASAIVDMLEDSDASVRYNALETLAKLEAAVLGQHAALSRSNSTHTSTMT